MKNSSRALVFGMVVGSLVATLLTGAAGQAQPAHVMATLGSSQWGPAPPMLPAGAQIAVLGRSNQGRQLRRPAEVPRQLHDSGPFASHQ